MKYQAVVHSWYIESKGWEVIDLEAETKKLAQQEADAYCHRKSDNFCHKAAFVIESKPERTG